MPQRLPRGGEARYAMRCWSQAQSGVDDFTARVGLARGRSGGPRARVREIIYPSSLPSLNMPAD
eukprot:8465174-Lingulodinium_polyedra.AAC.1